MINLCIMQDILKRYRFDLPVGIEHDLANWEKIGVFVSYTLTQARARVKKAVQNMILSPITEASKSFLQIKESIKADTNIFSLAQQVVHSTPCRVTVQLCARVALMVRSPPPWLPCNSLNDCSGQFMLNAKALRSTGTWLTPALNLFVKKRDRPPLKLQSMTFYILFCITMCLYICAGHSIKFWRRTVLNSATKLIMWLQIPSLMNGNSASMMSWVDQIQCNS